MGGWEVLGTRGCLTFHPKLTYGFTLLSCAVNNKKLSDLHVWIPPFMHLGLYACICLHCLGPICAILAGIFEVFLYHFFFVCVESPVVGFSSFREMNIASGCPPLSAFNSPLSTKENFIPCFPPWAGKKKRYCCRCVETTKDTFCLKVVP